MKTITYIFTILFATLIIGCEHNSGTKTISKKHFKAHTPDLSFDDSENKSKSGKPNTNIYGSVKNDTTSYIYFYCNKYIDTSIIRADGSFEFNLPIEYPQYARLVYKNKGITIFISPKNNLSVTFSGNDIFNSISFEGKGSIENNYLKNKHLLMLKLGIPELHLYEYKPVEFKRIVDSTYVVQKIFLDELLNNNKNIYITFREMEHAAIKYERATRLYEYPVQSSYYTSLPDDYFKFENNITPNDYSLIELFDYRMYLNTMLDYYTFRHFHESNNLNYTPLEHTYVKMKFCTERINTNDVRNYIMFSVLKSHIKYYGFKGTEHLFNLFEQECTNKELRDRALTPFRNYLKLQSKPEASLSTFASADGENFSWVSFKGKYIYVDVWATWCIPCKRESEAFEELAQKYKAKNIEFVSLSVDDDIEQWRHFIKKSETSYNQYHVNDIQLFLDTYQIKTIPHFLIIDEKGYLINANADRPSEIDKAFFEKLPERAGV